MRLLGIVFCVASLCPALAVSQQQTGTVAATTSTSQPEACAAGERQPAAANTEYFWRLRAYEHLDCALAILDDALRTQGSVITVSREEAERARAAAWAARDAAARIGR